MKCNTCRELLTAYLKAELEGARIAEVEEHLATCAECAKECEGARKVLAQLDSASEEPVMRLAARTVADAYKQRASDIHMRGGKVMFRIDGVMREVTRLPEGVMPYVINRFKIMADLKLAERSVPQDGRYITEVEGKKLDLRISVVPAATGDSLVIRLLDSSCIRLSLDQVYLVGEQREQLDDLLHRPSGLIVVTGPTGSGKTTTLYAILQELNRPELHVMSVEDPVEYLIEGVTQVPVNRRAGMDFRTAMRSIMRQDPDVIMCGEIRDQETAELCCQAAMTGHLVLTTLHTNDAVGVIRRLLDIGILRFMITSSLLGATAQRLLRKLCTECKEEYDPRAESSAPGLTQAANEQGWLQEVGVTELPEKLWRTKGCPACHGSGFRGRVAIYEVFTVDQDVLTAMAVKQAPLEEVEKLAATKVRPLKQAALERVLSGETTVAEAMRLLMFLPEY
jgi:type IV pilus assembly protein PilB